MLVLSISARHIWVYRKFNAGLVYYHNRKDLLGDLKFAKEAESDNTREVITVNVPVVR